MAEPKVTSITMACAHRRAGACGACFAAVANVADARGRRLKALRSRRAAWKRAAKGWRALAHEFSGQPKAIIRTSRPRFAKEAPRG